MNSPNTVATAAPSQVASDRQFQTEIIGLMPRLRAFSIRLCGWNLGEDIAQQALTKAWGARNSYQSGSNMKAWLFTIARNEYYSHQRRSWRQVVWNQDAGERIVVPPLQQHWASELSDVRRAMLVLPVREREAILLVTVGALSYEKAAAIAVAPVGSMKSRVSCARARLVKMMDGTDTAAQRSPGLKQPSGRRARIDPATIRCSGL